MSAFGEDIVKQQSYLPSFLNLAFSGKRPRLGISAGGIHMYLGVDLTSPDPLEPSRRHFRVSNGVGDAGVSQVSLKRACIHTPV